MGTSHRNSPVILPMWLAEQDKSKCKKSTNKLISKIIALFMATISFQAAAFVVAAKTLPEKYSKVLCYKDLCDKSMTILLCTLPPLIIFGFALNVALWIGIRLQKPLILTIWMVVYEMLFYLQLFFQISNILPLTEMVKSGDFVGFLKTWIVPMILLWLNNNAGQVIYRCRQEIQEELEEKKEKRKNRGQHKCPHSPGQSSRSSLNSGRNMSEFSRTMVLPKLNHKRLPCYPSRQFYRNRQIKPDKISLIS